VADEWGVNTFKAATSGRGLRWLTPHGMGPRPLVAALHIALLLLIFAGCNNGQDAPSQSDNHIDVKIDGRQFTLELAADQATRYQGLSDRKSIDPNGGMLFVFPRARELRFVMRRCLVPIDIIYLGPGGQVVSMHRMQVEPYDTPEDELKAYRSGWDAQFAIELAGGTLNELTIKIGQKIDLPLQRLKQIAE